jgi:hypothetical protein
MPAADDHRASRTNVIARGPAAISWLPGPCPFSATCHLHATIAAQAYGRWPYPQTKRSAHQLRTFDPLCRRRSPNVVLRPPLMPGTPAGKSLIPPRCASRTAGHRKRMPHRPFVSAQLPGLPGSTPNSHLWYDPKTLPAVADSVAKELSALVPARARDRYWIASRRWRNGPAPRLLALLVWARHVAINRPCPRARSEHRSRQRSWLIPHRRKSKAPS